MDTHGVHLLAEYHGCDARRLDDVSVIEALVRHAAQAAGASIVGVTLHRFAPQGVSGVVVIAESHLSVHTWPEHGYAAVDFFTCGGCLPDAAHPILSEGLRAHRAELMYIDRGLSGEAGSMALRRHHLERNLKRGADDSALVKPRPAVSGDDYLHPALEVRARPELGGQGVFTTVALPRDTMVAVFGGIVRARPAFEALPEHTRRRALQIDHDVFLVTRSEMMDSSLINHSCDPTTGLRGQVTLVARRDILPGDEITFDSAMTDDSPRGGFDCRCGAALCRGRVAGGDWRRPELQERYRGYFSPYIAAAIEAGRGGSSG